MKGMRIFKRQGGGYMSALEQSRPELYKTIKGYRDRLTSQEQKTFDKRANIQYKTTFNMPEQMRQAYFKSIDKQFAKPSEEQFQKIREDLKSKTFTPTRQYYDESMKGPTRTTGYYRDLSPEIAAAEKGLKGLTLTETEQRTRPKYEVTYSRGPYQQPKPATYTSELPKGARLTQGQYGQQFYQAPIQGFVGMGQQNTNPQYRRVGDEKYTVSTTRAQRVGDPEYDKQAAALKRLQTRHSFRNMPQFTGQSNLTSQNVYQQLGMAKSGGLKEDIQKIKNKKQQFSNGGRASVRGTKFKGVF
jgi:hypothetical protein